MKHDPQHSDAALRHTIISCMITILSYFLFSQKRHRGTFSTSLGPHWVIGVKGYDPGVPKYSEQITQWNQTAPGTNLQHYKVGEQDSRFVSSVVLCGRLVDFPLKKKLQCTCICLDLVTEQGRKSNRVEEMRRGRGRG